VCLSLDPRDAGLNPAEAMDFWWAIKIRSTPSLGWDVKPEFPRRKILRHVTDHTEYAKFSFLRPFLLLPPDVADGRTARELW
jgi:hypothetical protein